MIIVMMIVLNLRVLLLPTHLLTIFSPFPCNSHYHTITLLPSLSLQLPPDAHRTGIHKIAKLMYYLTISGSKGLTLVDPMNITVPRVKSVETGEYIEIPVIEGTHPPLSLFLSLIISTSHHHPQPPLPHPHSTVGGSGSGVLERIKPYCISSLTEPGPDPGAV